VEKRLLMYGWQRKGSWWKRKKREVKPKKLGQDTGEYLDKRTKRLVDAIKKQRD